MSEGRRVHARNVPLAVTDKDLRQLLENYGRVEKLVFDRIDRSAYITFHTPEDASTVLQSLNRTHPFDQNVPLLLSSIEVIPSNIVCVKGLRSHKLSGEFFRTQFGRIGRVDDVIVDDDMAFVVFKERKAATTAIRKMQGETIPGTSISYELSNSRILPENRFCELLIAEPSRYLVVRNVSSEVTNDDVWDCFSRYGEIESILFNGKDPSEAMVRFKLVRVSVDAAHDMTGTLGVLGKYPLTILFGKPMPTSSIWVGNVRPAVAEDQLKKCFQSYGNVRKITLMRKSNCAFVDLETTEQAQAAVDNLNGMKLAGWEIRLDFSYPKAKESFRFSEEVRDQPDIGGFTLPKDSRGHSTLRLDNEPKFFLPPNSSPSSSSSSSSSSSRSREKGRYDARENPSRDRNRDYDRDCGREYGRDYDQREYKRDYDRDRGPNRGSERERARERSSDTREQMGRARDARDNIRDERNTRDIRDRRDVRDVDRNGEYGDRRAAYASGASGANAALPSSGYELEFVFPPQVKLHPEDLQRQFSRFGDINRMRLREDGGVCLVDYHNLADARTCLYHYQTHDWMGTGQVINGKFLNPELHAQSLLPNAMPSAAAPAAVVDPYREQSYRSALPLSSQPMHQQQQQPLQQQQLLHLQQQQPLQQQQQAQQQQHPLVHPYDYNTQIPATSISAIANAWPVNNYESSIGYKRVLESEQPPSSHMLDASKRARLSNEMDPSNNSMYRNDYAQQQQQQQAQQQLRQQPASYTPSALPYGQSSFTDSRAMQQQQIPQQALLQPQAYQQQQQPQQQQDDNSAPIVWSGVITKSGTAVCRVNARRLKGSPANSIPREEKQLNVDSRTPLSSLASFIPPDSAILWFEPFSELDKAEYEKFASDLVARDRAGVVQVSNASLFIAPSCLLTTQLIGYPTANQLFGLVVPKSIGMSQK